MSKNKIFWGNKKSEVKKELQIRDLEEKKAELEEIVENIETALGPFNPNHKAYSVLLQYNKWYIIEVEIDLTTLQSSANILDKVYDGEDQAIRGMNILLAAQSVLMRRRK